MTIMRPSRTTLLAIVVALLGLLCAPAGAAENGRSDGDPIEGFNRGMFWFNDHVDTYVLVPVATVWDKVMPNRRAAIARELLRQPALPDRRRQQLAASEVQERGF